MTDRVNGIRLRNHVARKWADDWMAQASDARWQDMAEELLADLVVYLVWIEAGESRGFLPPVRLVGVYPSVSWAKRAAEQSTRDAGQWASVYRWEVGSNAPMEWGMELDGPGGEGWIEY